MARLPNHRWLRKLTLSDSDLKDCNPQIRDWIDRPGSKGNRLFPQLRFRRGLRRSQISSTSSDGSSFFNRSRAFGLYRL